MSTFKSYKNDAWEDPEINRKYESDAWTDCEFAKRYISDAWEEVWSSLKFTGSTHTTTTGFGGLSNSTSSGSECLFYFAEQDSGYVEVWTEGEFVNPTVTATIDGTCYVFAQGNYISTGSFSFFADSTYQDMGSVNVEQPATITKTHTFSGTFSKVGFRIKFSNWQVDSSSTFSLYEFTINGKSVRLTDVSDYNNT